MKKETNPKALVMTFLAKVKDYDYHRDDEWEFIDEHGMDEAWWDDENVEEHEFILDNIEKDRKHLRKLTKRLCKVFGITEEDCDKLSI